MGVEQKKKSNSFLMQGMILAAAGIISRLIGLAYRIPVNNILGDEGQGFYGCAFSIYNIALLLTSYSLPLAVSKLVSARVAGKQYKNASRIFKSALMFALVVGTIVAGIIFFLSDFIAGTIMKLELSAYALRVLAPGLLIVAVMGVLRGYFQGMGTMLPTAASQIIEQIVNAIVSVIGASYLVEMGKKAAESKNIPSLPAAYGAAGGTLGTVSGALFGLIFLLILMKAFWPKMRRKVARDHSTDLESYSQIYKILLLTIAPVILSTAIYNISETIDQAIFSNIMLKQGHSATENAELLGMFTGKYNTLIHIPLAVANAFGSSLIPSLTAAITTGTKKEVRKKINMVIRFSMVIAIPSFIAFLVFAKPVLALLYKGNIDTPAKMLMLGSITVVFYCLSTVSNAILQGVNKMSTPVKHAAISLVIHLVSVVFMLSVLKLGVYSLVIGNIIFSLSMCILNQFAIKRATGYKMEIRQTYLLPLIAAFIMGIMILIVYNLTNNFIPVKVATILTILVAVIVYAIGLLKLGALTPEEIVNLPKGTTLLRIFKKLHLIKAE